MQPVGAVAAKSKVELMHWRKASPPKSLAGASPPRTFSVTVIAMHQRPVSFRCKRLWRAGDTARNRGAPAAVSVLRLDCRR